MLIFIIVSLLIVFTNASFAQPEFDLWQYYDEGGQAQERIMDLYHTDRGWYYLCGYTEGRGWILRTDENGQVIWRSLLENNSYFYSVIETDNGDVVVGGKIGDSLAVIRLTCDGNQVWRRMYNPGCCQAIIELKEGDLVAAGWQNELGLIMTINNEGNVIWSQTYQAEGVINYNHEIRAIRETDGGIVAAGVGRSRNSGIQAWIFKINFNGNTLWTHSYPGERRAPREFASMVSTPNGFALGGSLNAHFCFTKVDTGGQIVVNQAYDVVDRRTDVCTGIAKLDNGGFCLAGYGSLNRCYPIALRIDGEGGVLWSLNFANIVDQRRSSMFDNSFRSIITVNGDQLVACGSLENEDDMCGVDGWLLRLEPDRLGPQIFYRHPEDSLLSVLPADSIQFIVRALNQRGVDMNYEWMFGDSILGHDTTFTARFDSLGIDTISCSVTDVQWTARTGWLVHVTDLFIRSFLPDTTELTLRRGVAQDFSIDVAATVGEPVNYNWWLTDITERHDSLISDQANSSYQFLLSGDYLLKATAYRGESSDTTGWLIHVKSVVQAFWPRNLNLRAHPDTLINFGVLPFNQQSDSLHYLWLKNGVQIDTLSEVAISFPDSGMQAIMAIVMDGSEGDTLNWTVSVTKVTGVRWQGVSGIPSELTLYPPSPNPFNSSTTIHFGLDKSAPTRLEVYGIDGRLVEELVNGRLEAGEHRIVWNAEGMPNGLYVVRLESAERVRTVKALLVK
jgi:hypothetical protein